MAKNTTKEGQEIKSLQFGNYPEFEISKLGSGPMKDIDSAFSRNLAVEGQTESVKSLLALIDGAKQKGLAITDDSRVTFSICTADITFDKDGKESSRENVTLVSKHSVTVAHLRRELLSDLVWIKKPERGRTAGEKTDSVDSLFADLLSAPVEQAPAPAPVEQAPAPMPEKPKK